MLTVPVTIQPSLITGVDLTGRIVDELSKESEVVSNVLGVGLCRDALFADVLTDALL